MSKFRIIERYNTRRDEPYYMVQRRIWGLFWMDWMGENWLGAATLEEARTLIRRIEQRRFDGTVIQ